MSAQNLSEVIYNHAIRTIAPFASEPGSTWAAVPTGPLTHEAWPLASAQFRDWLAHSFHAEHGLFPGHQSLRHAIRMIQARARFDLQRPKEDVFTRIGHRGDPLLPDALAIDLANPAHETVEITAQGWRTTNGQGWRFRSIAGSRPLPRPIPSSQTPLTRAQQLGRLLVPISPAFPSAGRQLLDSLTPLLPNLPAPALHRLAIWVFSALRPAGPYPILILTGPPASGNPPSPAFSVR
jgi:putative DNA primase/helicase